MSVLSVIAGVIRGGQSAGQDGNVAINSRNEQLTASGLPAYTEMTRLGNGWSAMNTTALAGLVVRPTTVANFTVWNGEPQGGKSYVVDRVFCHQLVSTADEARFGMWLCMHDHLMAEPTADITAFKGHSGKQNYGGAAVADTGATVVDNGWFPWGSSVSVEPSGVLPGAQIAVNVEGRLIVPPGAAISTQVVASLVGDEFTTGVSWYEVQLPLE